MKNIFPKCYQFSKSFSRYKTKKIKYTRLKYEDFYEEKKVYRWYIVFLRFIFDKDKDLAEEEYREELEYRIKLGLQKYKNIIDYSFESFCREKLREMGYEVVPTLQVREFKNAIDNPSEVQPPIKSFWKLQELEKH